MVSGRLVGGGVVLSENLDEVAAHFMKPFHYFRPKYVISLTLFQTPLDVYSLITKISISLSLLATALGPLFCFMVQTYVPLCSGRTGLTCKLPLESCLNLSLSSSVPSFLLQIIHGVGVPSALQRIIPGM